MSIISKIEEPYVKVTENIRSYPQVISAPLDTSIAGVIVSPTGPRLAKVSGPDEFLKTYTVDGNVPRNAHISFLNAYYQSFSSSLVLARSMNTSATAGIGFGIRNLNSVKVFLSLSVTYSGRLKLDVTLPGGVTSVNTDITPLQVGSYHNLARLIEINLSLADLDGNTIEVRWIDSEGCLLFTWLDSSNAITDLKMTVENPSTGTATGITIYQPNTVPVKFIELEKHDLYYKGKYALPSECNLDLKFNSSNPNPWDTETYAFIVGEIAYYHGPIDKSAYEDYSLVQISSQDEFENSINNQNGICIIKSTHTPSGSFQFTLKLSSEDSRPYIPDNVVGTCIGMDSMSYGDITTFDQSKIIFSIYSTNPSSTNDYQVEVTPVGMPATFNLTLTEGSTSSEYLVSLFDDATDNSGNNIYIENLNQYDLTLKVNVNTEFDYSSVSSYSSLEEFYDGLILSIQQTFTFGDSGLDLSACKKSTCLTDALYALEDQDIYEITYLNPFGITDSVFTKTMSLIGKSRDWFQAYSIPYTSLNVESIKRYCGNLPDDSNFIVLGPFDKNRGLLGWGFYLSASTLYFERIMLNTSTNRRYAPVFDQTYGIASYSDPVIELGKEDRTTLLNFNCPVNFVTHNNNTDRYYFNNNLTHQSMRNLASEENARRLINDIKRGAKRYMRSYISETNTTSTRSSVESGLTSWIKSNFTNTNYDIIDAYKVICNEKNNTTEVINSNKIAVSIQIRFIGSIKYVEILSDNFPLGVEFDQ